MTRQSGDIDAVVYRNMTAATVCDEYQPALRVPTAQTDIEGYRIRSDAARRVLQHQRLVYGGHRDEWLWYVPSQRPHAPLLVFFHGGYWRRLSADDGCLLSESAAAHGVAFASVNYSLCPHAGLDILIDQAQRAVSFLIHQSEHLGHSAHAIHVTGHSAGGHLAAMVAVHDPRPAGFIFLSGGFDLEPIVWTPINDDVQLTVEKARQMSPLFHRLAAPAAPQLVAVGSMESTEFYRQSQEWVDRRAAVPGATVPLLVTVEDRHHFNVMDDLLDPSTTLGAKVLAQLA